MDAGIRTLLVDFFRRGEVARDVKLLAARGALAPRAQEQLAVLLLLLDDLDPEVAHAAEETLDAIPLLAIRRFLARPDASDEMRAFFAARGIEPAGEPAADDIPADAHAPLIALEDELPAADPDPVATHAPPISTLSVVDRLKLAIRGTREQRAILIRDPNKLVAIAVLSSPRLTETEVETFSRMANVHEEVLRVIGTSRQWVKSYAIASALVRNPKTPPAISMPLVGRLYERDVKLLASDRNVPEALRISARKILANASFRRR